MTTSTVTQTKTWLVMPTNRGADNALSFLPYPEASPSTVRLLWRGSGVDVEETLNVLEKIRQWLVKPGPARIFGPNPLSLVGPK